MNKTLDFDKGDCPNYGFKVLLRCGCMCIEVILSKCSLEKYSNFIGQVRNVVKGKYGSLWWLKHLVLAVGAKPSSTQPLMLGLKTYINLQLIFNMLRHQKTQVSDLRLFICSGNVLSRLHLYWINLPSTFQMQHRAWKSDLLLSCCSNLALKL